MSLLTGMRRTEGQRVSKLIFSLLGGSTLLVSYASRRPTPRINRVVDVTFPLVAGFHGRGVPSRPLRVDGAAGQLDARLYEPDDAVGGLLVFFHGGGFILGSLRTHGPMAAFVAARARCRVLAVEYRRAPRHRFPAALEDAVAAFRWATRNTGELGVDRDRIAVGGDSAGGQLSAAVALALDDGEPRPCFAWLVTPLVDADVDAYPSARTFARGLLLTRANVKDMIAHYVPDPALRDDARLSVISAPHLRRMPPTYVATAGMDPIRDQGEAFAARLSEAGVAVASRRFENLPHGFNLLLVDPGARAATAEACTALGRALEPGP